MTSEPNYDTKQSDTKYHKLYLALQNVDDYFPKEDRVELLSMIKDLYNEHCEVKSKGSYGISYKTIHDDSSYSDSFTKFFESEKERDDVYEDWVNFKTWDKVFEQELKYPVPTPNVYRITKVFKSI